MFDRLHKDENAPQRQRHQADDFDLQRRIGRAGHGHREIRQDQRENRERTEHGERRGGALQLERLLEMPARSQNKAQADDAVEHDHNRRKHRIARDALAAVAPREHDRGDQRDLDHRHRDREQDRAERLAEFQREHLGMVDRREHRGAEQHAGEDQHRRRVGGDDMGEFEREQACRKDRGGPGPNRKRGVVVGRHRDIPLRSGGMLHTKARRANVRAARARGPIAERATSRIVRGARPGSPTSSLASSGPG